jgi:hypothetical protein
LAFGELEIGEVRGSGCEAWLKRYGAFQTCSCVCQPPQRAQRDAAIIPGCDEPGPVVQRGIESSDGRWVVLQRRKRTAVLEPSPGVALLRAKRRCERLRSLVQAASP